MACLGAAVSLCGDPRGTVVGVGSRDKVASRGPHARTATRIRQHPEGPLQTICHRDQGSEAGRLVLSPPSLVPSRPFSGP